MTNIDHNLFFNSRFGVLHLISTYKEQKTKTKQYIDVSIDEKLIQEINNSIAKMNQNFQEVQNEINSILTSLYQLTESGHFEKI